MRTRSFIAVALVLMVALPACGQRAGEPPRAKATATSIPVSALTAVHALRTNTYGEAPPFDRTAHDAANTQWFYQTLLALPPATAHPSCPISDAGTQFELTFFARTTPVLRAVVEPGECQLALIIGEHNGRQTDGVFWSSFSVAFGVPMAVLFTAQTLYGPIAPTPDPSWPQLG